MELSGIRAALLTAKRAGKIDIVERSSASLSDIIDVFQDPEYQGRIKVFHYGGHADSYQLMLESATGTPEYANAAGFAKFLGSQGSLELVFLNGCATLGQTDALIQNGIPSVISTATLIKDDIAHKISTRFYKGLAAYFNIAKSFLDAKNEVLTLTGSNNFRTVYWDELPENEVPQEMPWQIFPESGSNWRIEPPLSAPISASVKLGPFSHLMCNRNAQNDEFTLHRSRALSAPSRKPLIYLIHGEKEEMHESLVKRLSFERIGKNVYIRPQEIKNWPSRGSATDMQILLKTRLLEFFEGLSWGDKNAATLTGLDLVSHPHFSTQKNVIIQHNIPGEAWTSDTPKLLDWYINTFWAFELKDNTLPNFTVFINILYAAEQEKTGFFSRIFASKSEREKIIESLQGIVKPEKENTQLLSALHPINKDHLDTFLIESNLNEISDFLSLSTSIFSTANATFPMSKIELALKQSIDSYASKNPGVFG